MLYGLGITCLDRFLGRVFSHVVQHGMARWDRYLQWSLLISGQFPALCGPAGCELCSMALVSPAWTAFWAALFHNLCGQFPALCGPAGCELCSMASISPVWTAFWAAFFHNLCRQEWGCLR